MLCRSVMMLLIALVIPVIAQAQAVDLQKQYASAVEDAKIARADEIVYNLTAVVSCNTDLMWDDNPDGVPRVLVATWVNQGLSEVYKAKAGQFTDIPCNVSPPYVTIVPEAKNFCRDKNRLRETELTLRLEQLLGLPPKNGKVAFVELLVDPRDLFRPCPDPEITDRRCELDFRLTGFLTASQSYVTWFNDQKSQSYGPKGYPWTRLGYTYDWGDSSRHIGLSEFIIRPGATVKVSSVTETADYCTRPQN
jgi:hypothetical protein